MASPSIVNDCNQLAINYCAKYCIISLKVYTLPKLDQLYATVAHSSHDFWTLCISLVSH